MKKSIYRIGRASGHHSLHVTKRTDELAEVVDEFATRFLTYYADGLYGGPAEAYINHLRMGKLLGEHPSLRSHAIFVVVLDGLGASDGVVVRHAIEEASSRFQTIASELVLSTVPTITRYGKRALLTGMSPSLAEQSEPYPALTKEPDVRTALRRLVKG